jgi:UDP-glucose 4-epimerase
MKIIVTGGAGFIGSHVVDLYITNGFEVVVIDDLSTGYEQNINPSAKFYKMDICDPEIEAIFEKERPNFVNHHAAQINVRRSVAEPLFDAGTNILGSLNLLECARKYGVQRFIYLSSGGAVYGEPEYLPCDETHPVNPICPYGASKHTVEHYLNIYQVNYGLPYIVLRYANVYGPRQNPHGEAGVVAIFTGQMLSDEQVVINGDGDQQRDYVHVHDCARANLYTTRENVETGIYNIGCGIGTSVNEIYSLLKKITGYSHDAVHAPAKLGETRNIFLDATKAKNHLGWTPMIALDQGLAEVVDYFRANGAPLGQ